MVTYTQLRLNAPCGVPQLYETRALNCILKSIVAQYSWELCRTMQNSCFREWFSCSKSLNTPYRLDFVTLWQVKYQVSLFCPPQCLTLRAFAAVWYNHKTLFHDSVLQTAPFIALVFVVFNLQMQSSSWPEIKPWTDAESPQVCIIRHFHFLCVVWACPFSISIFNLQ